MSLDTVEVNIRPHDLLKVLMAHNRRGEAWMLIGDETTNDRAKLTLSVEGTDTCVEIVLSATGNWSASTHHTLGEAA